jgi:hypothetical protein
MLCVQRNLSIAIVGSIYEENVLLMTYRSTSLSDGHNTLEDVEAQSTTSTRT